jgi:sulfur-oxidizing protein SoxY
VNTRRRVLNHSARVAAAHAPAGWLPVSNAQSNTAWNKSAFDAKSVAELMKTLGVPAPVESKQVTLAAPDIAENGAVVPLTVATTVPGARRLLILVEKNPNTLAASFELGESIEANFGTRVKMNTSSDVYAVAITADGRALFARKDVKVTLGGCGS